ncbi:hypothetical protein HI914_03137 [Erysiphe necator]|nr:hypothetical protein HI914_03137 [Erysiphe necator]
MAGNVPEQVFDVLGELLKVTDATQFLSGVQRNPELVFESVKTLADQIVGDETSASQLGSSYKNLIEKEKGKELLAASSNLEAARRDIETLKSLLKRITSLKSSPMFWKTNSSSLQGQQI